MEDLLPDNIAEIIQADDDSINDHEPQFQSDNQPRASVFFSGDEKEPMTLSRVGFLLYRTAVFVVAVMYMTVSIQSFGVAMQVLRGTVSHNLPVEVLNAHLIVNYVGNATIEKSPLVQEVLDGSTALRNDTLYLETATAQSFTSCSEVPKFDGQIYSNEFLRFLFSRMQMYASYNMSYVNDLELIVPVVDCSFDLLVSGDKTVVRIYYLAREKSDPTNVILLSTMLSAQDYVVGQQFQSGAGTVLLVTAIDDMRIKSLTHHIAVALNYPYAAEPEFAYAELEGIDGDNYWILRILPNLRNNDPAKEVRMARRFGRYKGDVTSQSNIETVHWDPSSDPVMELSEWRWFSRVVLHDSWAWTHAIHGIFALSVIFDLSVLTFVIYRRIRMGHIWVGDAFSTISNMLLYRGVIVLVYSQLNAYWTITKMIISIGDSISDLHIVFYKPELVKADLLSLYMNVVSALSYVVRERVDPLLAYGTFELGWAYRVELSNLFPVLRANIANFAILDTTRGLLEVRPGLAALSPMQLLTAYEIPYNRVHAVASITLSIFIPMLLIVGYIAARKVVHIENNMGESHGHHRSIAYKADGMRIDLTTFELATGAALRKRFGVVTGYENYIMRDNQLFATIDAVYGNGFLVANKKFLIATQDLIPLILMKITRLRFTNLFVYEIINGCAVKETSRLVYPSTIKWSDLALLDVIVLA
ncbi:Transmembrane protein [Phytophthora megakarya]|uniref:Transmembrane protein n=1 Tax=Phytophthora megakarya TaxID=4795 RepID=A0A225WGU4_9STRA|nr:Transmembrane protein [Phytophthora megakarya]